MNKIRLKRMEKELLKVIAVTVAQKLRDKKLDLVTISAIKLSGDFSIAKVYFTDMSELDKNIVRKTLAKSSGFIKKEIAAAHFMRAIPELHFFYDEVEDNARNIENLLNKIQNEKQTEKRDE